MNFALRGDRRPAELAWFTWVAAAAFLTFPAFAWHVRYFRSPGEEYHRLILMLGPLLAVAFVLYGWLRRASIWRYELPALSLCLAGACLIYEPRATLVVVWMLAACAVTGDFLRSTFRLEVPSLAGNFAVCCGLGLGVLICCLFVLGVLKCYYTSVFTVLLAVPCVVFWRRLLDGTRWLWSVARLWAEEADARSPLAALSVVFAALFATAGVMVALAPSVAFDALQTHLIAVRFFAISHTLGPLPSLDYSYLPQGAETLMTVAWSLAGQPGAQAVSAAFFPLALLVVYAIARECGAPQLAAMFGVVAAGSIPFLHWTGSVVKNDLALACFQLLALYAYLRWRDGHNFNWICAGAFFLAMSFGIKHVAIFGAVPLGLLFAHAAWNSPRRMRAFATLLLVLVLFGVFWQVRTFILTGNPVFPYGVRAGRPGGARGGFTRSLMRLARMPWTVHFDGTKAFESLLPNPMGVFLIMFAPAWLLVRRPVASAAERACLFYCALYLVYWGSILAILRYAIAPVMLLAALCGLRVAVWYSAARVPTRISVVAAAAWCFTFAFCAALIVEVNGPQLAYFTGKLDKPGYLRRALATYASLEFLRGVANPGDAVYGVGNCSKLYAPNLVRLDCTLEGMDAAQAAVRRGKYRYLILPTESAGDSLLAQIAGPRHAERLWNDSHFAVYRLQE